MYSNIKYKYYVYRAHMYIRCEHYTPVHYVILRVRYTYSVLPCGIRPV